MRCVRHVVSLMMLAGAVASRADYIDYHFKLDCDPMANRAEIVPFGVWDETVYSADPQECVLRSGTAVYAKMGMGPSRAYGRGGANPSTWLSIWVDKALVLSRIPYGCRDERHCLTKIVVTEDGVSVCDLPSADFAALEGSFGQAEETCETTARQSLSKSRDTIEFPRPNEPAPPPPGTVATLFAKDESFCKGFQANERRVGNRARTQKPVHEPLFFPHGSTIIQPENPFDRQLFDVNNDGSAESVVQFQSISNYRDADIYFISDIEQKLPNARDVSMAERVTTYAKFARRILPHYWSSYTDKEEKDLAENDDDDSSYNVKMAGAPWWDSDDVPTFRLRYLHLTPFRFGNATYFITSSHEADKLHWYAVLHPNPDYTVTEMCVFQIVRHRY